MPSLRDIKRRIQAVKNTRQITKAMKMVAAAKLRKAQGRMMDLRPYAEKMERVMADLVREGNTELHPLLNNRARRTAEVLVITSDRGLCGAFNSNIIKHSNKLIARLEEEGFGVSVSVVGKKAADHYKRREREMRAKWTGLSGNISYGSAQEIAVNLMDSFLNEEIDEVIMVYNQFKNVVSQIVTEKKVLPVQPIEVGERQENGGEGGGMSGPAGDYIFEPSQAEIYNMLIPKSVEVLIYRALLESQASEEAARMTAMGNATSNADEMIDKLTLQYNKARQATITMDLMDIVGGVEALKDA